MLTIFSTPKPFRGHIKTTQRNAIRSWTLLGPDVEITLFGDEEGAAETAREFGIRHEPLVERTEKGTKYLAYLFDRAQELSRHDLLCYVNCDIILMSDFRRAVERVAATRQQFQPYFLMVGRRWDTGITAAWDFGEPHWEERLRALAFKSGRQRAPVWIDYFVFSRGVYYRKIPPFVIGRPFWDPWLIWYANSSGAAVVDASRAVVAVHQNHDYSYHPKGAEGVGCDEEARRNHALLGNWRHYHTTESAPQRLTPEGWLHNPLHWFAAPRQALRHYVMEAWFALLDLTRSIRHPLGLKRRRIPALPGNPAANP
jgi:hypothetical protein